MLIPLPFATAYYPTPRCFVLFTIVVMVSLKGNVIVQLPLDVFREGSGSSLAIKQLDAVLNDRYDSRLCFVKPTLEILRYMTP